jgi:hypothetical protein
MPKGYQSSSLVIPMAWSLVFKNLKGAKMKRKSIIQGFSICAALIFVILTSGCATTRMYKGEELSKQEIAVIKGSQKNYFGYYVSVDIYRVDDGEERKLSSVPILRRLESEVEVMPGFHKVFVMVMVWGADMPPLGWNFTDSYRLEFTAEAGHKYKIKAVDIKGRNPYLTIVGIQSGAVVAKEPINRYFIR